MILQASESYNKYIKTSKNYNKYNSITLLPFKFNHNQ